MLLLILQWAGLKSLPTQGLSWCSLDFGSVRKSLSGVSCSLSFHKVLLGWRIWVCQGRVSWLEPVCTQKRGCSQFFHEEMRKQVAFPFSVTIRECYPALLWDSALAQRNLNISGNHLLPLIFFYHFRRESLFCLLLLEHNPSTFSKHRKTPMKQCQYFLKQKQKSVIIFISL